MFVKMIAKGERLLPTVPASTPGLTVSLHQRAIYDDIDNAVRPIVMIQEHDDLLAETLQQSP